MFPSECRKLLLVRGDYGCGKDFYSVSNEWPAGKKQKLSELIW